DGLPNGGADTPVLVGDRDLHREGAGGCVDVAELLVRGPRAHLGTAVAPVDAEAERAGLIGRGGVGGAEREGPHLAARPRGRAAQAGGRRHIVDRDVQAVAGGVRAVLVTGGRADGTGPGPVRVGVAHRAGVAGHRLNAAVAPGD